jgi:hypothetical protein
VEGHPTVLGRHCDDVRASPGRVGRATDEPREREPSRIAENINVFDFDLSGDEMAAIDGLDTGRRGGPAPEAITLEAFSREIPEA